MACSAVVRGTRGDKRDDRRFTRGKAMKVVYRVAAALLLALTAGDVLAQASYPEQPIKIIVGFPPGVAPDITSRLLGDRFTEAWGKPVVVENVTGASGNIAVERVAKAAPD